MGYFLRLHFKLLSLITDSCKQAVQLLIVDFSRIKTVDTVQEVAQNIHVIGKGIERTGIDAPVHSHPRGLGRHEPEVVARLQIVPVLVDARVVGNTHTVGNAVKLVECFTLHRIPQPCTDVTLLIHPAQRVRHVKPVDTLQLHT